MKKTFRTYIYHPNVSDLEFVEKPLHCNSILKMKTAVCVTGEWHKKMDIKGKF